MKKNFITPLLIFLILQTAYSQEYTPHDLPNTIYSGKQGKLHVQGVVVDQANGFVYFSFTDKLVKTDLSGKVIGSVTGLTGHLGDLVFDDKTGKIYGSLEFKDNAIGKGIRKTLGVENQTPVGFYIAIFDGSRIVKPDMDAENENLLRTIYLKEVVEDYLAMVKIGNKEVKHRFGCSGIDGITLAPGIGKPKSSKKFLYVAYGMYGDTTRNDNDYQVILKYNIADWDKLGQNLHQGNLHQSGPKKPLEKYFVKTGNTTYGIQNLAWDKHTGNFYAAVYRGKKSKFPNYGLFVIDGHKKPEKSTALSGNREIKIKTLSLLESGMHDVKSGIRGWHFNWGTTGLCPLGDGLFYISHNAKKDDGQQVSTIYKYRWIGDEKEAFILVE